MQAGMPEEADIYDIWTACFRFFYRLIKSIQMRNSQIENITICSYMYTKNNLDLTI